MVPAVFFSILAGGTQLNIQSSRNRVPLGSGPL